MKVSAAERELKKLKNQIKQIEQIVANTKINSLWEHEASLRKKLKLIAEIQKIFNKKRNSTKQKEANQLYKNYEELLNYVSERLLLDYNQKNNAHHKLEEIIDKHYENYKSSGLMNVLITKYIPKLINEKMDIIFPQNPKDEYKQARKIKRTIHLHLGETNTGKTYNAMQKLKESRKGIYLAPLRILALENYERLNNEGVACNLFTGEEEIIHQNADHISCTIEKLNINEEFETAVIDEIQMIVDEKRGAAWTRALLGLKCREIHVCGALNAKKLLIDIIKDIGDDYTIKEYKRNIPLEIEEKSFKYKDFKDGDALVVFSKKRVLELALFYSNLGIKCSIIYGDLPPEVRKKQYAQFLNKETSILVTTDAIGMGVNLPIKRIVFMEIKKFDGKEFRFLNSQEVKQIAGRAGRKGIYDVGYVASYAGNYEFIKESINKKDNDIEYAILGPSEDILSIENVSLTEKLSVWSEKECKSLLYEKMDIDEYLIVLYNIRRYKLSQIIRWKLLKIPFDVDNNDLMDTFISYVDELFIAKRNEIFKPIYKFESLDELEIYYQKINLYYSFGKIFGPTIDEEWIYEERNKLSEKINNLLLKI
ncbi:helicase-related protein [Tepidibacter aestuarii]|uniref:helicase-related protein n=1 Tax=Tepidibacter aestuarii TaxID=2925782 RepID=UPI0020BD7F91|nr:helicase-related protein [Tepidibacter aestuarii]CAH2214112.1 ATP-dependent RNA helicase SUPV3L1/SUV3 [Tepidibacter aestuarii]